MLNIITLIVVFAFNILIPQFLQSVSGASPLQASLVLFPAILLSCLLAPVAGRIFDKYGIKWLIIVGFALMAVFSVLLAVFISSPNLVVVALLYIPVILGSALVIGPVQSFGLSFLNQEQNPHGVTLFSTGFQIAGCIGASLFANIYASSISSLTANGAFLIVGIIIAVILVVGLGLSVITGKQKQTKETQQPIIEIAKIRDIMKTDVYTVFDDAKIMDVMHFFVEKKISGCPIITKEGKLIGFISDGDIVRFLSKNHTDFKSVYSFNAIDGQGGSIDAKLLELLSLNVLDVASKDFFCVDIIEDLGEVCRVLAEMHKKKVPVLENGNMVGIITRSDITKYIMKFSLTAIKKNLI